ncbi:MAG: hypothetical protein AB1696_01060 [Planctomycetota bacterium]
MSARKLLPFLFLFVVAVPTIALADGVPRYIIHETTYTAQADKKKFDIDAAYKVELLEKGLTAVPLLPADTAVIDFSTNKVPISTAKFFLRRSPAGCEAIVEEKGNYEIKVKFVVKIDRSGRTARAVIPFPIASRNELTLDIPEADLKIVAKPELPIEITRETKTATTARLYPPALRSVELEWYPMALAKELEAVVVAQEQSFITFSDGLVRRATTLNYTVTRGKVSALSLRLPKDVALRDLTGDLVEKWTAVQQAVEIKLKREVENSFALHLETEEPAPSVPAAVKIEPIASVEAGRQRGAISMLAEEGLMLRHRAAINARQADITPELRDRRRPVLLAYAYDSLPAEITVGVERAKPKITATCESHVELERGVVTIQSNFTYDIRDIGVYEFRLKLHKGLSVLEVKGGKIVPILTETQLRVRPPVTPNGLPHGVKIELLDYEVKNDILAIRTREKAIGPYALMVVAQMNLVEINGVVIPRIETMGAESERGVIGVSVGPDVTLQHHSAAKTRQIDVSQLPPWLVQRGCKIAYTYDQPGGTLSVKTIKIEPEITAKEYEYIAIEEYWVRQEALFAIEVERAGMFNFRLRIPANMTVTEVRGQAIADWAFKADSREVWVDLAAEVRGGYAFQVFAERRIEDLAADIPLGGIEFIGTKKLEGWLGVGPRASVELREGENSGLRKLGVGAMPPFYKGFPEMNMAYTYSRADWALRLRTAVLQPQLTAEIFSLLRFQSGLMTAVEEVHLDIKKAEIKDLQIVLPPKAVNSTVDGDEIKTSEFINGTWHITLRNKMKGQLVVWVNYEQAISGASGQLNFTGITLPRAERVQGFIVVAQARSDAEIKMRPVRSVTPVDESALPPDFVSRVTIPIVRSYRFTDPKRELDFDVTSLARAEVAKARAEECIIKTIVKPQGQAVNYLTFKVQNSRKQFLKLDLGKGADLWGTYIRGEPVKSNKTGDGAILIPIMSKGGADRSFDVSVIWANPLPTLGVMRTIDFITPDPDVSVGKVQWDVFFPRDYQIRGTSGNMEMQIPATPDVSLVAIIWSYIQALLGIGLNLLKGLLFPVAIVLIVVFAVVWLWLRAGLRSSLARIFVSATIILLLAFILASILMPTMMRSKPGADMERMPMEAEDRLQTKFVPSPAKREPAKDAYGWRMESRKAMPAAAPQAATAPQEMEEIGVRQQKAPSRITDVEYPEYDGGAKAKTRYTSERAREMHEKALVERDGRAGADKYDRDKNMAKAAATELAVVDDEVGGKRAKDIQGKPSSTEGVEDSLQAAQQQAPQQLLLRNKKKSQSEMQQDEKKKIQQVEADQLLNRAASFEKQGRLNEAQRDLETAQQLDASNVQVQQRLDRVKGMAAVAGAQMQQAQELTKQQAEPQVGDMLAVQVPKDAPVRGRVGGEQGQGQPAGARGPATGEAVQVVEERAADVRAAVEHYRKLRAEGKHDEARKVLDDMRRQRVVGGAVGSETAKPEEAKAEVMKEKEARATQAVPLAPPPPGIVAPAKPAARPPAETPAAEPESKPADAAEIVKKTEMLKLYDEGKTLFDAGKWGEARGVLQRVKDSGVDVGWWRSRSVANMISASTTRLAAASTAAATGVGTLAQAIQQQTDMQREGEGATLLTKVVGGQAKGALPIELTVPTAGTVPYKFQMPLAGDVQGTIRISCIRTGAALCLQGVIAIVILGAALGIGWRRTGVMLVASFVGLMMAALARTTMATPASDAYYVIAVCALTLAMIILAIRMLVKLRAGTSV